MAKRSVKKDTHSFTNGRAAEAAAKLTHTNFSYVATAKAIKEQAPELIEVIRAGKLTIPDGKTLAKLPRLERRDIVREIERGERVSGVGADGKHRPIGKSLKVVARSPVERKARIEAVNLIHGDCRKELKNIASGSVDCILSDPIYPEIDRQYGRLTEEQWLDLMKDVVRESRRVLKPKGSAVFIFQPNYDKIGKMRLWVWEFMVWAGREMGLIQDVYWWNIDALPLAGTNRKYGLLRHSVKIASGWVCPTVTENRRRFSGHHPMRRQPDDVPILPCESTQAVELIATVHLPRQPMIGAAAHPLTCCHSLSEASRAAVIRLPPVST